VLAGVDGLVLDGDLGASGSIGERHLRRHRDVPSLHRAPGRGAERRAERIAAAEERVEDVRERAEATEPGLEPARPEPLVAVAVVHGAPLRVGQDLVGLGGLLELLLGLRIVLVHVRVQLASELAEGLLDLLLVGVPGHAKDVVWITLHRRHFRRARLAQPPP
jgi:hypothetical protein